jgi:hypothetical protein
MRIGFSHIRKQQNIKTGKQLKLTNLQSAQELLMISVDKYTIKKVYYLGSNPVID